MSVQVTPPPLNWWKNRSIELAFWPAADAYKADPSMVDPVLETVRVATKTSYPTWIGLSTDGVTGWAIATWESTEQHMAFHDSPDFEGVRPALEPALADPAHSDFTVLHAHSSSDPAPMFLSPVTALAFVRPKEGTSASETERLLADLLALANAVDGNVGSSAQASVEERPGETMLVIGWGSTDAAYDFRAKIDDFSLKEEVRFHLTLSLVKLVQKN